MTPHNEAKKGEIALCSERNISEYFTPQVYEAVQTQALKLPKICYIKPKNIWPRPSYKELK